jgi:hypothetical protein
MGFQKSRGQKPAISSRSRLVAGASWRALWPSPVGGRGRRARHGADGLGVPVGRRDGVAAYQLGHYFVEREPLAGA